MQYYQYSILYIFFSCPALNLSPLSSCFSYILILLYIAFCTIMAISRQKEARSQDYTLLLFRMTSRVLYSTHYHRQHCTLRAFEQLGALYMHNHDDKYPARPGFEPGSSKLQAPVDTNEPSGQAVAFLARYYMEYLHVLDVQLYYVTRAIILLFGFRPSL